MQYIIRYVIARQLKTRDTRTILERGQFRFDSELENSQLVSSHLITKSDLFAIFLQCRSLVGTLEQ